MCCQIPTIQDFFTMLSIQKAKNPKELIKLRLVANFVFKRQLSHFSMTS